MRAIYQQLYKKKNDANPINECKLAGPPLGGINVRPIICAETQLCNELTRQPRSERTRVKSEAAVQMEQPAAQSVDGSGAQTLGSHS